MEKYNNKIHRSNIKHIIMFTGDFAYYYYFKPYLSDNHGRCRDRRKLLRKRAKHKENEFYRNIINNEIYEYNLDKQGYEYDFLLDEFGFSYE